MTSGYLEWRLPLMGSRIDEGYRGKEGPVPMGYPLGIYPLGMEALISSSIIQAFEFSDFIPEHGTPDLNQSQPAMASRSTL